MELTKEQIQDLYKFTQQHFVEYYDVQTELVDHLANDIEQICKEEPSLSFEQARDKAFKKFGVFGFSDVVEERMWQMNKKYWEILFRFVKSWFKLPKIIVSISIVFAFCIVLQLRYSNTILSVVAIGLAVFLITRALTDNSHLKSKKKNTNKTFLLESIIKETKDVLVIMILLNLLNVFNRKPLRIYELSFHWIFIIALLCILLCILMYVTMYVIPRKADELLQETYPEYKMVNSL